MLRTEAVRAMFYAVLAGVLVAPAAAQASSSWLPVDSGAPATVKFLDVAASSGVAGPVVIAAGQDGEAGVIVRLSGGVWSADALPVSTGAVTDVTLGGGAAYAIAG